MKAQLITRYRNIFDDGSLVELVVWKAPNPVPPTEHGFKYRLVYVVENERVIGFDNEIGKGDHKHIGGEQYPYQFIDIDRLLTDFFMEVEQWKKDH